MFVRPEECSQHSRFWTFSKHVAEAYLEPTETSTMEFLAKIVKSEKLLAIKKVLSYVFYWVLDTPL